MQWEEISRDPLVLQNFDLLKKTGILECIEKIRKDNRGLEELLLEAYDIFRQESIEELIDLIIRFLSDKFIPSSLTFILNEGIMINKIKILSFASMKSREIDLEIESLEEFERFFRKYSGTTSYLILEEELAGSKILHSLQPLKPEIIVPVLGISGLYGVILFGPKILGEEYSRDEIAYIDRLMRFTSIAIQNTIHYEHSVKDSKTGLYNHNFFIHRMHEQMARCSRIRQPFSVIVMDIDKFKFFNDTYGHLAGDEVILGISQVLKKTVREGDLLSRFGGEEFTVLLPFANRDEAWNASERMRRQVEKMETVYQGTTLKVTISLGVATFNPYESINEKELLKRADEALYQSKKSGRNRSSHFSSGLLQKARNV